MKSDDTITIPLPSRRACRLCAAACVALLAAYGVFYISVDHVRITEDELEAARAVMETDVDWFWLRAVDYYRYDGELLPYRGHFSTNSNGEMMMTSGGPAIYVRHVGPVPPPDSGAHEAILLINGAGRNWAGQNVHEVIWLDGERTALIPYRTIHEAPPGGPP